MAALRGDLDAVAHGLATLASEASGLLDRTADPEAVAGLTATLQLTPSVLETTLRNSSRWTDCSAGCADGR